MKRAALYLRVSTVDQHPETQLHDLRSLAAQRGFEIVAEYTDRISGAKARRPGLDSLIKDAGHGRFDVVLVWSFDRFARRHRRTAGPSPDRDHRRDRRTRTFADHRACPGWHAASKARRPAHRTNSDSDRPCRHPS